MTNKTKFLALYSKQYSYPGHPYHLVEPSPWPIFTSFALLTIASSGVMYFHGYAHALPIVGLGFLAILFAMILWFRDVSAEGTYLGHHTFAVQKGLSMGVALFIVSEVFFFISFFWAFYHSSLAPTVELGAHWPPQGILALSPYEVPLLNTVILLSSGAAITYAHHSYISARTGHYTDLYKNRRGALVGIIITVVLAVIFTALQAFEYVIAPFSISDGAYGSTFFMATGFHGLHVIIGTLFIVVAYFRITSYQLTDSHHLGFESAILYWHFVDVVWLFLYVSIYWWGS